MNYSTLEPSCVKYGSLMIRYIIPKLLGTQYLRLRIWSYYFSKKYSNDGVHAEFMGMSDSTQGSK